MLIQFIVFFLFLALALSGSGALYVVSRKSWVNQLSVVDKENGTVARTLDTSQADSDFIWTIKAHENVLLLVESKFFNTIMCMCTKMKYIEHHFSFSLSAVHSAIQKFRAEEFMYYCKQINPHWQ